MSTKEDVLQLLQAHKGYAISGEELANQLDKSRTAIWKAVQALRNDGHQIDSVTNKGYTLVNESDPISASLIQQLLLKNGLDWHIETMETTTSTNDLAKQYANQHHEAALFISEEQTAGRGRLGRQFISPARKGLYMSLVVFPNHQLQDMSLITCATAVAAAQALETYIPTTIDIKWVNDLYHRDKKIAGILTEAISDFESRQLQALIIGIGINLIDDETAFPPELHDCVGSVFQTAGELSAVQFERNQFIAALITRWYQYYQDLQQPQILQEYRKRSLVLGQEVKVIQANQTFTAQAISITDNGHLIVQTDDGKTHELSYGEVSIRPKKGKF